MQGWIKLHRQLLDWEWYDDINTTRLFVHLLLVANHEDKNWRGIEIKRGQRLTSLDKLAKETGLSVSKIRTCLKKLKSTNEVTSKSHSQHTVFTIENYDSYQGSDKQDDKPVTYESQTNDKPLTTNKNDKEGEEYKDPVLSDEIEADEVLQVWNALNLKQHRTISTKAEKNIRKIYAVYKKGKKEPAPITKWLCSYISNGIPRILNEYRTGKGIQYSTLEYFTRLNQYEEVKDA
jgi:hypothetical protein